MFEILRNDLLYDYAHYCSALYFAYGIDALLEELETANVSIAVWDMAIEFDDELSNEA